MLTITQNQITSLYAMRKTGQTYDLSALRGVLLVRYHDDSSKVWRIEPDGTVRVAVEEAKV